MNAASTNSRDLDVHDDLASARHKQLAHDRLGYGFEDVMNPYDVLRRAEVLVGDYLGSVATAGKLILDAGCGLGGITGALVAKGAHVVALDIGPHLVEAVRARYRCHALVGTLTGMGLAADSFDVVLSSEAIEHTPDPVQSVRELYRVLKPGGDLVLSTPNRLWLPPVVFATAIGVRPDFGFENFLWPGRLRSVLEDLGARILDHRGIHLWPFHIRTLWRASRSVDRFGDTLLPLMINQCIHCTKPIARG